MTLKISTKPQKTLRPNGGGGAIDRLVLVERLGGTVIVIPKMNQARSSGIPIRNAIGRCLADGEFRHGLGNLQKTVKDLLFAAEWSQFLV